MRHDKYCNASSTNNFTSTISDEVRHSSNSTQSNSTQSTSEASILSSINLSGEVTNCFISLMVSSTLRDEDSRRKYEQDKEKRKTHDELYGKLENSMQISSGRLAVHNHYCLDNTVL
jgi:hypothetical protein